MKLLYWLLCVLSLHTVAAEQYTLYFTRHAEYVSATAANSELTKRGRTRTNALAAYLADKNIQDIYSSDFKPAQHTAAAVAKKLDQMVASYDPEDLSVLAKILRSQKRNALIVGQNNTMPQLISLVGGQASTIDEQQYGEVYVVTVNEGKGQTHIQQLPPLPQGELAPLTFNASKLQESKHRYRVSLQGREVGYMIQDVAVKDEHLEFTQLLMAPELDTNAIVKLNVDKVSLMPLQMRMSGTEGKMVDVQLSFVDNHVTGHSDKERLSFLEQGHLAVDQWLPPYTYLKDSVLAALAFISFEKPQYIHWFDAGNREVKRIQISQQQATTISIDGIQYAVNRVELIGGAPSYVAYITQQDPQVVKLSIPDNQLVMEKVPLE